MLCRHGRFFCVRKTLYIVCFFSIIITCSTTAWLWHRNSLELSSISGLLRHVPGVQSYHPIDRLIKNAETRFSVLLAKQTLDLSSAADEYRKRRGRHPPPGFDAWYAFASEKKAIMIEDLFDQIYRDMRPFWGVSAKDMRYFARTFQHHISVRNGTTDMTRKHTVGTTQDRMEAWLDLVKSIASYLPDLDMAVNVMDESRVIVPWEDIGRHMQEESRSRKLLDAYRVQNRLPVVDFSNEPSKQSKEVKWDNPDERFWDIARVGCPLQSPGRHVTAATNFSGPPPVPVSFPQGSFEGYVQNWTMAKDPCLQPHLQEYHGTFVEPVSTSTTRSLVPIFGESKLSMNNDILIPAAAYVSSSFSKGLYSDASGHGGEWRDKISGAVWRGVASGGRNREENWTRFHRHRFVSMMNGTAVRDAETNPEAAGQGLNFMLRSYQMYNLVATKATVLGTWLERVANVGFTQLLCFPVTEKPTCNYTDPFFNLTSQMDMAKLYDYKLLPDIDGNSFSGRYLAFLRSTSVPIKATIYSEWHDDRLILWLHFVPMDNSFVDMYGILDYFVGTGKGFMRNDGGVEAEGAHDGEARHIATRGKNWADSVLRKEDMQIYMLRLLLEYARLCDDEREVLGFVGDLVERPVLGGLEGRKGVHWTRQWSMKDMGNSIWSGKCSG